MVLVRATIGTDHRDTGWSRWSIWASAQAPNLPLGAAADGDRDRPLLQQLLPPEPVDRPLHPGSAQPRQVAHRGVDRHAPGLGRQPVHGLHQGRVVLPVLPDLALTPALLLALLLGGAGRARRLDGHLPAAAAEVVAEGAL